MTALPSPGRNTRRDRFRRGDPRNVSSNGATTIVDSPSENSNPPSPRRPRGMYPRAWGAELQVQETKRMTVYGPSGCETISYRNCIRHTPCAAGRQRHTECAGYIGIRHFIAPQALPASARGNQQASRGSPGRNDPQALRGIDTLRKPTKLVSVAERKVGRRSLLSAAKKPSGNAARPRFFAALSSDETGGAFSRRSTSPGTLPCRSSSRFGTSAGNSMQASAWSVRP